MLSEGFAEVHLPPIFSKASALKPNAASCKLLNLKALNHQTAEAIEGAELEACAFRAVGLGF